MQAGEADWLEIVQPDAVGLLRRRSDLVIANRNPFGDMGVLRFNHLHPPFDNSGVRRAVMLGLTQDDYMRVVTGNDQSLYRPCLSFFPCGTPYGREFESNVMAGDIDAARAAIMASGYPGRARHYLESGRHATHNAIWGRHTRLLPEDRP